ncbi:MAG: signal recognition particle protein [Tepidisphaerales bacterium]
MFESLSERFQSVFRSLSGRGKISEENVREAMREVRTALLEADVHLEVVNQFTQDVLKKALGTEVIHSLQPGQLMVKIVYDELVRLMGPVDTAIMTVSPGPTVIMLCGLQGSGKTTTAGKMAMMLIKKGHRPLLAAADLQRPAAVEQLKVLGGQIGVPVYADESKIAPHGEVARGAAVAVCKAAVAAAKEQGRDIVILDTAGRLAIDQPLMAELKEINAQVRPHQIYLVLDAMTGQDAVNSAKAFNEQLELDGLILTKMDSDTRGGALLSAKMVTGKPVKFIGMGEKLERLDEFRPEGMAQRILGMGDIVGLVNEAMEKFDQEKVEALTKKMQQGVLTLDDFMQQMEQVKKLGPMTKILGMVPGMGQLTRQLQLNDGLLEGQMKRMRAIYDSMTRAERENPEMIEHSRRRRIAAGAGVQPQEVGQFVKQFETARDMMRAYGTGGRGPGMGLLRGMMGLGGRAAMGGGGVPMLKTKKSGFMEKKDRNKKKGRR